MGVFSVKLTHEDWETIMHVLDCGGMYELVREIQNQTGLGNEGNRDQSA